jgi:short-subunit dehydrogenase
MLERGRGHVAIVSSGAGIRSFPGAAVYGATKAAQRGFGEALRHELKGTGVGLTMVYPGQIRSALHDHEKGRMPDWYKLDRAVPAEPLAAALVEAVEKGRREVFYPPNVRLLRIAHGLRPGLADAMLRRIMDRSAAP